MRSKSRRAAMAIVAAMIGFAGSQTACSGQTTAGPKSSNTQAAASASRVSIFDGKAGIVLPKGFRAATDADKEKRANKEAVRAEIFAGPAEGCWIETETFAGLGTDAGTLADIKGFNERLHEKYSKWERSEAVKLNGREWYVFEWKMPDPDDSLATLVAPVDENGETVKRDDRLWHYINYFTVIDGTVHGVYFIALRDDMPNARTEFLAAFDSIEIKK